MNVQEMVDYVYRRDKAILSLDEQACRALFVEAGVEVPADKLVFWATVHKVRCSLNVATEQQKTESRQWLVSNGFKPYIE